jgi:hypothetical protein
METAMAEEEISNMFDFMLSKDLIYTGIDEGDRSFETEMILVDPDVMEEFEKSFMDYNAFQDIAEKPYGNFELVDPRLSVYQTAE